VTDVVWITPTYPWAESPVGGIFFRTQATALVRAGLAVTVACPTPLAPWPLSRLRPRWRAYARAPERATADGVTIVRPRYPNLPGEPRMAAPDRFIARAAWSRRGDWRGARLVHGHATVTGMAARRLAREAGLPYVLTFHGSDINRWPDDHPDQLQDLTTTVREAGEVIAVSARLAERIRELTGRTAVHLPIGVNHAALADAALPKSEARHSLGLPADAVIVLFVGNLLPAKGVPELIRALTELGEEVLGVFVGAGSPAAVGGPSGDSANATGGAAGRLAFVGPKPHDVAVRYMSAADVLVLPSRSEGLPTVVVEAGSLGLPVIGSEVGGIPELIGEGRGTLLPEVSVPAIRDALAGFLADRPAAAEASARLAEHVRADYDVDRNASRLLEIYRELAPGLAQGRAGAGAGAA
jgi:teichuronic acid biosynthesis glycosyltransferase TuaC